jgi:hypothetical protein
VTRFPSRRHLMAKMMADHPRTIQSITPTLANTGAVDCARPPVRVLAERRRWSSPDAPVTCDRLSRPFYYATTLHVSLIQARVSSCRKCLRHRHFHMMTRGRIMSSWLQHGATHADIWPDERSIIFSILSYMMTFENIQGGVRGRDERVCHASSGVSWS